jgi:hypothetical protein
VAGISVAVFALPIFIDKTKLILAFAAVVAASLVLCWIKEPSLSH